MTRTISISRKEMERLKREKEKGGEWVLKQVKKVTTKPLFNHIFIAHQKRPLLISNFNSKLINTKIGEHP